MGFINEAQNIVIEIIGTILFIAGAVFFIYGLVFGFIHSWYIDIISLIIGLYLMGYKAIPDKITRLIRK